MAVAMGDAVLFPLLLAWRTIAGSKDAGAALHGWEAESRIAAYIPVKSCRIKGCIIMFINHLALLPASLWMGGMWFFILLIPFVYYTIGKAVKDDRALGFTELTIGAIACLAVIGI